MERPEFLIILNKAIKGFNGFGPLGIFSDIDEPEYKGAVGQNEAGSPTDFSIDEFIACYFDELKRGTVFSEHENIWMLQNVAMHPDSITLTEVRLLADLYLKMIAGKYYSRVFCLMILIGIDKTLPDNQSFVSYILKQLSSDNFQLSQKDTLIDMIEVMADLGAFKHEDKALLFTIRYARSNNLLYVIDRVLDMSMPYGVEMTNKVQEWIKRGN